MLALGNGLMTRYAYDNEITRLLRLRSEGFNRNGDDFEPASNLKQDYNYSYDLSENITGISNNKPGSGVGGTGTLDRTFSYDALYRLLSATGREVESYTSQNPQDLQSYIQDETNTIGYKEEYSFDLMGNILELSKTKTHPTTASRYKRGFSYVNGKNSLVDLQNGSGTMLANFTHNANGAIETKNGDSYYWGIKNQLLGFHNGTTVREYYCYSGGTRVKKIHKDAGKLEVTVYIDGVFEHRYKVSGGTRTKEQNIVHVMHDRSRIARKRIGDLFPDDFTEPIIYNLEDILGSSSVTISTLKATLLSEEYSPFGESTFGSYAKKRYRFVGKEKDASGLYYYGARYYMNWSCRFVSLDPLADRYDFFTPYQYAGNKPINSMDIDGLEGNDDNSTQTTTARGAGGGGEGNGMRRIQNASDVIYSNVDKHTVDMSKAKPLSNSTTETGFPRNHKHFWKEAKDMPFYKKALSANNLALIKKGSSPVFDQQWLDNMPKHSGTIMEEKIHHHHINRGRYATALPESLHIRVGNYRINHPRLTQSNVFTRGSLLGASGKTLAFMDGLLMAKEIYDIATSNPHALSNTIFVQDMGLAGFETDPISMDGKIKYVVHQDGIDDSYYMVTTVHETKTEKTSLFGLFEWESTEAVRFTLTMYDSVFYDQGERKWIPMGKMYQQHIDKRPPNSRTY